VRSLFPRCLPTLLSNIAAAAPATPLNTGMPAIEVLLANARNIRKIAKDLPATVTTRETAATQKAA
jgi:hypothetical protein